MRTLRAVTLDGTKIRANASKHRAMSYGHMKKRQAELQAEVDRWLAAAEARGGSEFARVIARAVRVPLGDAAITRIAELLVPPLLPKRTYAARLQGGTFALLAPGTAQFAITYFLESTAAGATTISASYDQPWEGGQKGAWTAELALTVRDGVEVEIGCDAFGEQANAVQAVGIAAGTGLALAAQYPDSSDKAAVLMIRAPSGQ